MLGRITDEPLGMPFLTIFWEAPVDVKEGKMNIWTSGPFRVIANNYSHHDLL